MNFLVIAGLFLLKVSLFHYTEATIVIDGIPSSELFATKIEPRIFNWSFKGVSEQFSYLTALEGYPDLPSWMRYMYSSEYHAGFLYGTPPEHLANKEVRLSIVALNKINYETRKLTMVLNVVPKFPATYIVQMKIDNLNWIHMMDPGRVENLKNIYRKDLWTNSESDLHLVFMESAVNMGGRLPLRPQQREGVIVHLGSNFPFSPRLLELQEEIRPLYKLTSCTYKRTSVQKTFEEAGFKLDWCAFRIIGNEASPEVLYHNHGMKNPQGSEMGTLKRLNRWNGISKAEVIERNYIDEFAFAFAIPGMIFAVLIGILSAILCFHHEKFEQHSTTPTVQMVQSSDTNNHPVTTLKSLKDPNLLIDNISIHSQSPCNSLHRNENNVQAATSYLRPKPPPYKPPNCVDI